MQEPEKDRSSGTAVDADRRTILGSAAALVGNDLKREHLMRMGSFVLHELNFDNLSGNGRPE